MRCRDDFLELITCYSLSFISVPCFVRASSFLRSKKQMKNYGDGNEDLDKISNDVPLVSMGSLNVRKPP